MRSIVIFLTGIGLLVLDRFEPNTDVYAPSIIFILLGLFSMAIGAADASKKSM